MLLILLWVLGSSLVQIFAAQPRPVGLLNLDEEPTGPRYTKFLSPPLAFSYTSALKGSKESYEKTLHSDSKGSDSIISHTRYKAEPEVLKRLSSKRMLKPKKHHPEKQKIKEQEENRYRQSENDFYIYVPESSEEVIDLVQSPIVVPELSEEQLKSVEDLNDGIVEQQKKDTTSAENTSNEVKAESVKKEQSDQNVQETHHKKKPAPKPKDTKYEKKEEVSKEAEHHESDHKEGDKKHLGEHEHHKVEKEHHIKADKSGHYGEKGGDAKKYHKGHDFHAEFYEEDEGDKGTKYEEEGENEKGHTTKGEHNIRKKDEYEKKVEFFDEYHDDGEDEEEGAYEHEDDFKKGHNEHKEHEDSAKHHDAYADEKKHHKQHSHKYAKAKHHHHDDHRHHGHGNKHKHFGKLGDGRVWKIIVTHGKKN